MILSVIRILTYFYITKSQYNVKNAKFYGSGFSFYIKITL